MASVVFMGTPDFAAGILQAVIDAGFEVTAVFTQPDRPKGRKGIVQMPPVKEKALAYGIKVFQPERIRSAENTQILQQLQPDFIIVAAFGQIIPQSILDIPPFGCLNVHASLLPRWRGAAPIQWSILSGDSVTGVTIMRMDAGLDTGDMILKKEVPIREDETGDSLFAQLMEAGMELVCEAMASILNHSCVYTPQPAQSPTPYAKMLTRQSGLIDWTRSAGEICRMVRAFDSWPGTYTFLDGKMLKIMKAGEVSGTESGEAFERALSQREEDRAASSPGKSQEAFEPGEVVLALKDALYVRAGDGLVRILEVQPEGKKRMDAGAFLRGYRLRSGDHFRMNRQAMSFS